VNKGLFRHAQNAQPTLPQLVENALNLIFKTRFDADADGRGFAHGANVAIST
jgi:hypothetical protein